MYCNNNHLKLIDMKVYSVFYEIFDENDNVVFCSYNSILADFSEIDSAKRALKDDFSCMEFTLKEGYSLWFNIEAIYVSDYTPLRSNVLKR